MSPVALRNDRRALRRFQAMVSMMLPSGLVEPLEELELEPPRSAIELSTKDETIDCAD